MLVRRHFWLSLFFLLMTAVPAGAVTVQDLEDNREWRLKSLTITGNEKVSSSDIKEAIATHPRPWYALWRPRPAFAPGAFSSDLQIISDLFRDRGYYEATVTHDLQIEDDNLISAKIVINEGTPVRVRHLSVDLVDAPELK